MVSKRKPVLQWDTGDYFLVRLNDGSMVVGQALDLMMKNIVSVAFLERRYNNVESAQKALSVTSPRRSEIFAALATWRDPLDEGRWIRIGQGSVLLPQTEWPNEEFRKARWVGARHYNTALVESFLEAFYALRPWNELHDPLYYDRLLIRSDKKPNDLVYRENG
jgi:hypothetical protein